MSTQLTATNQFTQRELDILHLVAKATLRKNIADQLQMSIHTVDTHLRSIHKKTNTTTMAELVLFVSMSQAEVMIG